MSTIDFSVYSLAELREIERDLIKYKNTAKSRERKKVVDTLKIGEVYKNSRDEHTYLYKIIGKLDNTPGNNFIDERNCILVHCITIDNEFEDISFSDSFWVDYDRFINAEKLDIDFDYLVNKYNEHYNFIFEANTKFYNDFNIK